MVANRSPVFDRVVNVLVFGGFAVLAVASNFVESRPYSLLDTVALCGTALVGLVATLTARLSRVWGVAAFLTGWFAYPWAGLAFAFAVVAAGMRFGAQPNKSNARQSRSTDEGNDSPPSTAPNQESDEERGFARSLSTLRIATELGDKVVEMGASFHSPYGDGMIPVLIKEDGAERALYVEEGSWDTVKQMQALQWLALLRTSDREDLEVVFRSQEPVPDLVKFYTPRSARTVFELVGLLNYRWEDPDGFAEENSRTFKRLAKEFFDLTFDDDMASLAQLDEFVLHKLRGDAGTWQLLRTTTILMGSYLGEVMRQQCPGGWVILPESLGETELESTVVELRSEVGTVKVNVFGKIRKLLYHGIDDSTEYMARTILERMGITPQ